MNKPLVAAVLVIALGMGTGITEAKGCLKGAAVGGVAGHVAGGHGVIGAAAGCVIGRHRANAQEKREAAAAQQRQLSQPGSQPGAPAQK